MQEWRGGPVHVGFMGNLFLHQKKHINPQEDVSPHVFLIPPLTYCLANLSASHP